MFFSFPENARWNAERHAVEFGVEIGEYRGVVRVPRRMFQRLLLERPPPRALPAARGASRRNDPDPEDHRRAQHGSVGAEHAAIADLPAQQLAAGTPHVDKL